MQPLRVRQCFAYKGNHHAANETLAGTIPQTAEDDGPDAGTSTSPIPAASAAEGFAARIRIDAGFALL